MHACLNSTPKGSNAFYKEYQRTVSLTLRDIRYAHGEEWELFSKAESPVKETRFRGYDFSGVTALCYKGLNCLFREDAQFLVLTVGDEVCYQGYCDNLPFFRELCRGISPGGIWNDFPKD